MKKKHCLFLFSCIFVFVSLFYFLHVLITVSYNMYNSVVTILEFLTSIRYLEKYRYSIPFSIPRRKKTVTALRGSLFLFIFKDKYNKSRT